MIAIWQISQRSSRKKLNNRVDCKEENDGSRSDKLRIGAMLKIAVLLMLFVSIASCNSQDNDYVEPPPPRVTIAHPIQKEVINYLEFTGTTRASEEVAVRARVRGFLQSIHFTPGTMVEKGALLFVIDPREYQAAFDSAVAEMNAAEAQFKRADIEFARAKRVFDKGAGADTDVVKWRSERDIALASVARARANVERARLNLSYTKVLAPISGRVGRNLVDIGNLVGEGESTLLTQITRYDPIYVYFNLNERDLLRAMEMVRERMSERDTDRTEEPLSNSETHISMGLANEKGFPHKGRLDFAESGIDPKTGTLQMRGVFRNAGELPALLPGLFARIRMPIGRRPDALLVTERAIGADQGGSYLLIVDRGKVVEKRSIRMGQAVGGLRVIEEGLRPDDLVVVNGLQRARPGATVDPQQVDMASLAAAKVKTLEEATQ
jgi:RND family efflux transporter MFP subunit